VYSQNTEACIPLNKALLEVTADHYGTLYVYPHKHTAFLEASRSTPLFAIEAGAALVERTGALKQQFRSVWYRCSHLLCRGEPMFGFPGDAKSDSYWIRPHGCGTRLSVLGWKTKEVKD
jgi:hypothetical protein